MSQIKPNISHEPERETPFFKTVPLFTPKPMTATEVPQHPYMSPNGTSNVHNDAYMTDTYKVHGPLGGKLRVRRAVLGGIPVSVTFDRQGRINTLAIGATGARRLALIDPHTLRVIATDDKLLPSKPSKGDFGGGGYLYLNNQDQMVVPTVERTVMIVGVSDDAQPQFQVIKTYDLNEALKEANGASYDDGESIQSVIPDWENRLWFVSRYGVVGYIAPDTGEIHTHPLINPDTGDQEHIGNSLAVDEAGPVYIVSNYALYSFGVRPDGKPKVIWREPYDRGNGQKPGQNNDGSGTTPTLTDFQGKQYVSITDNADPQMNVLVYRRESHYQGKRLVCKQPVFQPNGSCTENSLVGANNSLVVENNYGYASPTTTMGTGTTGHSGVSRVDFAPDGSGGHVAWTNDSSVPSVVSKLSLSSGLIYTYTKKPDGWYFTAIDFSDGKTVYEALIGVSIAVNSHYAGLFLGPDGRTAYVGTLEELISVTQV